MIERNLCRLEDVCDFQNGFAFKSTSFTKEGEPILRISDIQGGEVDDSNVVYFNPSSYKEDLSRFVVYPNDIVIAMSGGTTGKVGVNTTGKSFYLNQRVGVFREKAALNHNYLYYYLITKSEESLRIAAGAAQPNLSTAQIRSFVIPVPPLSEQQRIVDILDDEFAKIDALKENAEKNLQNAKDLFQAVLRKELEPKEGWETKHLNEIATYSIGLTYKPDNVSKDGTIVLRSSNIQNAKLDLEDIVRVNCTIKDELYVKDGDILMCSRNGSKRLVGKVAKIENTTERMTFGTFMTIIRSVYNPLLFYFFQSNSFRKQLESGENPMINQITKYMLNDIIVSIPTSIAEQERIVDILDVINNKCEVLQRNYEDTVVLCNDLKQALLRKAFNGEL